MHKITEPGIYLDVPSEDYFADCCPAPSLTQSVAKILLDRSPAHARLEHPKLAPLVDDEDEPAEKYDAAKAIGNAAHRMLIGRGKTLAVEDFPNWTTKVAQQFKKAAIEAGQEPILGKHMRRASALVVAARRQLTDVLWSSAFSKGNGEVVVAWQEENIWFRTLIDWMVSPTEVYDLKTSGISCAPHNIGKVAADAGWDIQAAMHERALDAVDPAGHGRRRFRFVAVENEPPYALVPVELSEAWLTMGRKKLAMAIGIWSECLATGEWPSYPPKPVVPEYPGYKETSWLQREEEWAAHPKYRQTRDAIRAARAPMLTDLRGG